MAILKKQLKILRFVHWHHSATISTLNSRFGYDDVREMLRAGYLECPNDPRTQDAEGYKMGEYPPSSLIFLSKTGLAEVESREWFDAEYVITKILVPIAIGIISSVITNWLVF